VLFGLVALSGILLASSIVATMRSRRSQREIDDLRVERDRLVHSVSHDPLSGLLNRVGVIERIDDRISRGRDDFAVLYLDIDRFKSINDTLGHAAGDVLLAAVGRRLLRVVGQRGDAARIGGDEFVVVLDESGSVVAASVADRLARSIVEPIEISGRLLRVSASIGVATGPWSEGSTSERSAVAILDHANQALHGAKNLGRDRVEIFDVAMRDDETRRAHAESELRRAIDRGDIRPFFVPEYDVDTGGLVGSEIVPRWVRDDGSVLDAQSLLDIARDANTVERLTAALIREARPFVRRLHLLGLPSDHRFRVALPRRITPRAWRDGQIVAAFHEIDLSMFTLDVRASLVAVDPVDAVRVLNGLRERGARICLRDIDDLSILGTVPVDEIRVSGDLVASRDAVGDALLHSLADLVSRLHLGFSADDVLNLADSSNLRAHGCPRQQGPFLGLPIPASELQSIAENDLLKHLSAPAVP